MRNLKTIIAFALLAAVIFYFKEDHASWVGLSVAAAVVLLFWYLNGLKLMVSSLRNLLILASVFAVIVFIAQALFPSDGDEAKMGQLEGSSLDPAIIARLKESHEIALQLYLDHEPTTEERYVEVGTLPATRDGLHYEKKAVLDRSLTPMAAKWVRDELGGRDLAQSVDRIQDWFHRDFKYTLEPGKLESSHPLDELLFSTKKGFCEHYAASLATLLTLKGERTRVVVGYAGGKWNPILRRLTFEEADAHAWVQVVDKVHGQKWQIVDPTDWVMPEAVPSQRSDWTTVIVPLALVALIALAVLLARGRADALEALQKKIASLERKNQLASTGLTIQERLARLAKIYPDRETKMRDTLSEYLASYFAQEPTKSSKRKLTRSLAKW